MIKVDICQEGFCMAGIYLEMQKKCPVDGYFTYLFFYFLKLSLADFLNNFSYKCDSFKNQTRCFSKHEQGEIIFSGESCSEK